MIVEVVIVAVGVLVLVGTVAWIFWTNIDKILSLFGSYQLCCKCTRTAHYELNSKPGTFHCAIHAYEYERENPLP